MYSIIRQGDTDENGILQYCCDKVSDIKNLPTIDNQGSVCIVIENSSVYMLGSDKQWHELK